MNVRKPESPTPTVNERLRTLPSVNDLTERLSDAGWLDRLPRTVIANVVRDVVESHRRRILAREDTVDADQLQLEIEQRLKRELHPPLEPVINATGVILHTGLGRSPIAIEAVEVMAEVARGYAPVEVDLATGRRGHRSHLIRPLLCEITGAGGATVVNNNAAAMTLALAALAKDRTVIVSRGELVEIGGSFRLPEVIEAGGARLREVGTTNKTRLADYERAIDGQTGALLKVHTSNFRIEGFVQEASIDELASLAREHELPLIHDIGSGMLVDPSEYGLPMSEPNARESIARGADLVLFSGDKLLGATQAGIIVGRTDLIECVERHPMMRAMRVDKVTLAALGRVLQIHRDPKEAARRIPALRMAMESIRVVRERANQLVNAIGEAGGRATITIEPTAAYIGGGSVPGREIESVAVVLRTITIGADDLAAMLRTGRPAVMARIADDALWLDLRTVFDEQVEPLAAKIRPALV